MVKVLDFVLFYSNLSQLWKQGWEFDHQFFELFAWFLWAKEQKSDTLVQKSNRSSLSFVMSDLSGSLTITLLFRATWVIRSRSLFKKERLSEERWERFPLWHKKRGQLNCQNIRKIQFVKKIFWANCLFLIVKRAICVICSRSLFCHERPER